MIPNVVNEQSTITPSPIYIPPNNSTNNHPLHRQQYPLAQQQFVSNSSSNNPTTMAIDNKSKIQQRLQQQHQIPSAGFHNDVIRSQC